MIHNCLHSFRESKWGKLCPNQSQPRTLQIVRAPAIKLGQAVCRDGESVSFELYYLRKLCSCTCTTIVLIQQTVVVRLRTHTMHSISTHAHGIVIQLYVIYVIYVTVTCFLVISDRGVNSNTQ